MRMTRAAAGLPHSKKRLNVAEVGGFAEGGEWIARRDKFVRDVPFIPAGDDAAHDAVPLHLLGAVEFMPAGYAAGMEMSHTLDIFLDGSHEIAFHNLHVIDVVEKFHAGGIHGGDNFNTPGAVVAHVVVMVHFAVE